MHRLNARRHTKEMPDPRLHHAAEPVKRGLRIGEIDRGIEHVRARPVFIRCLAGQNVDADFIGRGAVLEHPRHTRLKLHRGVVGHHDPSVIKRHRLIPEQAFRGANLHRVGLTIEDRAQDDLRHLLKKQRREGDRRTAHDRQIGGFQRRMLRKEIAEGEHSLVVVDNVAVFHSIEFSLADHGKGVGAQAGMQRPFCIAGFLLRRHLVAGEIGHHEIAGRNQMAVIVTLQQMPSGCKPEILCHPVSLSARLCPSPLPPLSRFSARRRNPVLTGCGSVR